MKQLTQEQVQKKYYNKYISINSVYCYDKRVTLYEVLKVSSTIREDMTLGQDVGTSLEYCR